MLKNKLQSVSSGPCWEVTHSLTRSDTPSLYFKAAWIFVGHNSFQVRRNRRMVLEINLQTYMECLSSSSEFSNHRTRELAFFEVAAANHMNSKESPRQLVLLLCSNWFNLRQLPQVTHSVPKLQSCFKPAWIFGVRYNGSVTTLSKCGETVQRVKIDLQAYYIHGKMPSSKLTLLH